jgi:23S rRNA pseudoU1915 N3-methylase RlmH
MKVTIRAIGKDNSKELKSLIDEYLKRLPWTVQIEELVCNKKGSVDEVKKWEGILSFLSWMKLVKNLTV